jgi:hypothetical protein
MLIDYLPPIVKKIRELQEICAAEQPNFDEAEKEIENILCRVFVSQADEKGIMRFEKVYGITPSPEETIEQRRVNILIRNIKKNISLSEVLTILYNYTVNIELDCDYNEDEAIITLKDETTDIAIIYKALDEIAPLNVYIKEKMLTENRVSILKTILYEKMYYNYALGKWNLGRLNFGSRGEKTKLGGDKVNLQPKMFTDVKNTIESDIKKIVVNDTLDITEFEVKKTDDRVIVNYHIRAADTNNIKKVSFKTENNEEVATLNTDLNIDVDIEITQEFIIEEATE